MTNQELDKLIAKDAIVKRFGFSVKAWSMKTWNITVVEYLAAFHKLPAGEQSKTRMRYRS